MAYAELLIPFLFTFSVVYGALEISDMFKNKRVNLVISIVFGIFAISNPATIGFVNSVLPYAVILFIAVFFVGFVLSFIRGKKGGADYTLVIIIAALALAFLSSNSSLLGLSLSGNELVSWMSLALIALIFLAAYYMSPGR